MLISELCLEATLHDVRIGDRQFHIVRMSRPMVGTLTDIGHYFGEVDEQSFWTITVAWALAARSAHSIIYVPSTKTARAIESLELILVHHGQQLSASSWKSIRNKLGKGKPTRIHLPEEAFDPISLRGAGYREGRHFREDKDVLRWSAAARTVMVTGSRIAFEDDIRQLVVNAEKNFDELPDEGWMDVCVEIGNSQPDFHLHPLQSNASAGR
jgi:hypothetical protein